MSSATASFTPPQPSSAASVTSASATTAASSSSPPTQQTASPPITTSSVSSAPSPLLAQPFPTLPHHHHPPAGPAGPSAANATTASASSRPPPPSTQRLPLHPHLPSPSTTRQVSEARSAVVASIGNLLDGELQSRAALLHANSAAIDRQFRDVERALAALRKEDDKLHKVAADAARRVKELGNVQNWAEVLEKDFLQLEETMRLVHEGGARDSGDEEDGCGSCCSCSDGPSETGTAVGEGEGVEEGAVVEGGSAAEGPAVEPAVVDEEGDLEMRDDGGSNGMNREDELHGKGKAKEEVIPPAETLEMDAPQQPSSEASQSITEPSSGSVSVATGKVSETTSESASTANSATA